MERSCIDIDTIVEYAREQAFRPAPSDYAGPEWTECWAQARGTTGGRCRMRRMWVSCVLAVAAGVAALVVPLLVSVPAAASSCREPMVSVRDPISGGWMCVWDEDRYGPCPPARCSGHLPSQSPPPSTSSRRPVPPDTWQDLPERVPVSRTSHPSPWPHRIGVVVAVVVGAAVLLWWYGYTQVRAEMREAALDEADDDDEDEDEPEVADPPSTEGPQHQEHQLLMDELITDELRRMRGQGD